MDQFAKSEWNKEESAREFIENADMYILDRKRLFKILKSLYKYFLMKNIKYRPKKVLDLGCGDGRITQELLKADEKLDATLVDGSTEMLVHAKNRLKSYSELKYIHSTFHDLVNNDLLSVDFDFVVSSLAIHHLPVEDKRNLFKYIYNHLNSGGIFLNVDVVRAPSSDLEEWYLELWREWIIENEMKMELSESFQHIPDQYKNNPDNHPDLLEEQLSTLKSTGFKTVDCHYKYGIFSIYSGQK